MKKIVFVCTGNTCRSPMAEGMFRVLAEKYGVKDVECSSCGISAYDGMPVSRYAVTAAAEYGADIRAHRSRSLTEDMLADDTLFVCMTKGHASRLLPYLPPENVRVLGSGISDPFGGDEDVYRRCAAEIYAALEAWIQAEFIPKEGEEK